MARVNPERPETGLGKRTRETVKLMASDTQPRAIPCRQCGRKIIITGACVDAWAYANRTLRKRGQAPLQRDEVSICDREECIEAERIAYRQRYERERAEVDRLLRRIERGEAVSVSPDFMRYRPSDYAEIKEALRRRRAIVASAQGRDDEEID